MSVTMYAVQGVGSNTNSGSTVDASPKASGTGAATTISVATVDLSVDTPDLSGVVVGDTIRLNARTDGKNASVPGDIFEITAVDDGADTVTVTPVPSSSTSSVTWAIGGSFATLTKLVTSADIADILYASGTFDESVDMINAVAGATQTTLIRLIGYTTTPGDGGRVVLDSNNTKARGIALKNNLFYWSFENIRITRFTAEGFRNASTSTPARFINCRVDNCGGTYAFAVPAYSHLVDCEAVDNTSNGFDIPEMGMFIRCLASGNGARGFRGTGGNHYFSCVAIGNTTGGFYQVSDDNHKGLMMFNCLVDGAGVTTTGVLIADDVAARQAVMINCVVRGCTTGVEAQSDNSIWAVQCGNNVADNGTDYVNIAAAARLEAATLDPEFVDRAGGDYTPTALAPQVEAGYGWADSALLTTTGEDPDIGPVQHVSAAGVGASDCGPWHNY